MRESLRVGVATAVAGAFVVFAGPSGEAPQQQLIPEIQTCADDFPGSSVLQPEDYAPLPPINLNTYLGPGQKSKVIGSLSIKDGVVTEDLDKVSPPHQSAIREAISIPFVACTVNDRIKSVNIWASREGDAAFYTGEKPGRGIAKENKAEDRIDIMLGGEVTLEDGFHVPHLFTSKAVLKEGLIHEAGHAHFQAVLEKARAGDEQAQKLLHEFTTAYAQEARLVFEANREQFNLTAIPVLESFKQQVAAHHLPKDVAIIQEVIDALNRPHGLAERMIVCEQPQFGVCGLNGLGGLLFSSKSTGLSREASAVLEANEQANKQAGDRFNQALQTVFEKKENYPVTDESSALPGVSSLLGNPYMNAHEAAAAITGISSVLPVDVVVAKITALPPERRALTVTQFQALAAIYKKYSPRELSALQIDEIVERL